MKCHTTNRHQTIRTGVVVQCTIRSKVPISFGHSRNDGLLLHRFRLNHLLRHSEASMECFNW